MALTVAYRMLTVVSGGGFFRSAGKFALDLFLLLEGEEAITEQIGGGAWFCGLWGFPRFFDDGKEGEGMGGRSADGWHFCLRSISVI